MGSCICFSKWWYSVSYHTTQDWANEGTNGIWIVPTCPSLCYCHRLNKISYACSCCVLIHWICITFLAQLTLVSWACQIAIQWRPRHPSVGPSVCRLSRHVSHVS
jgi:hypothetical protein